MPDGTLGQQSVEDTMSFTPFVPLPRRSGRGTLLPSSAGPQRRKVLGGPDITGSAHSVHPLGQRARGLDDRARRMLEPFLPVFTRSSRGPRNTPAHEGVCMRGSAGVWRAQSANTPRLIDPYTPRGSDGACFARGPHDILLCVTSALSS